MTTTFDSFQTANILGSIMADSWSNTALSFTLGAVFFLGIFQHDLYNRSKSAFMIIVGLFVSLIFTQYGFFNIANIIIIIMVVAIYFRAIMSRKKDGWVKDKSFFDKDDIIKPATTIITTTTT